MFSVSVPDFVLYWICFRSRIRFRWIGWNGGQSSLPGFLGYDFACQHAWMLKMSESVGSEPLEYTSGEKSSALPTRSRVYGLLEQWLFTRSLRGVWMSTVQVNLGIIEVYQQDAEGFQAWTKLAIDLSGFERLELNCVSSHQVH